MQIDAHQHFWRLERGDYYWLTPELALLHRDYLPQHLEPHLLAAQIDATILVQAAPTEDETRFLLDIARATPFVAGVVGWIDMTAQNAPDRLARLAEAGRGRLKGVRPMIQDIADPNWILSESLDSAFDAIVQLGLRFDALVRPRHLDPLLKRLDRCPELRVVIDHAAKPDIVTGGESGWWERTAIIAARTSAMCKFSGLMTENGLNWHIDQLAPFAQHILDNFGARRVMWGSDWPVINLTANYRTWHEVAQRLLAGASAEDRAMIFGGTAAAFYGIETNVPVT